MGQIRRSLDLESRTAAAVELKLEWVDAGNLRDKRPRAKAGEHVGRSRIHRALIGRAVDPRRAPEADLRQPMFPLLWSRSSIGQGLGNRLTR